MRPALIEKGIPGLVAVLAVAALLAWGRAYWIGPDIKERVFEVDRKPPPATAAVAGGASSLPALASGPQAGSTAAVAAPANVAVPMLAGEWPRFRGVNGDNVSPESTPLARSWGPQGPRLLWSVNLGEGYAAPAVRAGRVYVLDYDQGAQSDALRCFSLTDGAELWRRSYPSPVKRNHGMSRTIPAVTDKYVVTLGPRCVVMCTHPVTGRLLWKHDLVAEFDATVPQWYAGQCPLIDGGKAIVAPGGKALMAAIDCATGKLLWRTPNPNSWEMTHSSIAVVTLRGRRMYVYCASGGVAGVDARTGALLWQTPDWTISTATVPSPIQIGDGRILLTGGYGSGAMILQVEEQGGRFSARILQRMPPSICGSEQQTPILYQGRIYCVLPNRQLACLDPNGKQLWTSGDLHTFGKTSQDGKGPYVIAGGTLYILDDSGLLTLVQPSPAGYQQLAQAQIIPDGQECWGPLAVAGGRLLARDLTRLVCVDITGH